MMFARLMKNNNLDAFWIHKEESKKKSNFAKKQKYCPKNLF